MLLGGRYELLESVGRGSMATVYRGQDLYMKRPVAVKVLREVISTDPTLVTSFQQDAKLGYTLQHPNIVQVYDYGQSDSMYYIIMELVEGTDLRRYLRFHGILSAERASIIAHDVALGLGAAHRRDIVNRYVKPQTILIARDDTIKLTNFHIATDMTYGRVQYYAPEQAQGEVITPAVDVYALGIVMYEMLTRRAVFDGDTPVAVAMQHVHEVPTPPSQYNPNIPPALEAIVLRCLEKVPERRYQNGTALAQALEAFMKRAYIA